MEKIQTEWVPNYKYTRLVSAMRCLAEKLSWLESSVHSKALRINLEFPVSNQAELNPSATNIPVI